MEDPVDGVLLVGVVKRLRLSSSHVFIAKIGEIVLLLWGSI